MDDHQDAAHEAPQEPSPGGPVVGVGQDRPVTVFGAQWCADCLRSKRVLDRHEVPYTWIDLVAEPDRMSDVIRYNDGAMSIPVIVFPDGGHLTEPSDLALEERLRGLGLLPDEGATR